MKIADPRDLDGEEGELLLAVSDVFGGRRLGLIQATLMTVMFDVMWTMANGDKTAFTQACDCLYNDLKRGFALRQDMEAGDATKH